MKAWALAGKSQWRVILLFTAIYIYSMYTCYWRGRGAVAEVNGV
jgi:hypothetical protein